jgi:hypothetical protein
VTRPEDLLRDALHTEVADVDVSAHALDDIRRRIARRRRRSWRLAALGVPALATAAAVAVVLATCSPPHPDTAPPPPADSPEVTVSTPAAPSSPATEAVGGGTGPSPGAGRSVPVPVYYLGRAGGPPQPSAPLLYREFRPATLAADTPAARTRAAVELMLTAGSAADPDYATYWPRGVAVRDARADGDTVTVDLSGVPAQPPAGDPALGARSVDQLVYTATAASGAGRLRLLLDGSEATGLWGLRAPFTRRPPSEVQARLWLIEPAHGATTPREMAVHVAGIVFEATAQLRVRDPGGAVVAERTLTLSAGPPAVGEYRLTVPLPPGRYTVEVYAVSAADGSEQFHDDHDVTVR